MSLPGCTGGLEQDLRLIVEQTITRELMEIRASLRTLLHEELLPLRHAFPAQLPSVHVEERRPSVASVGLPAISQTLASPHTGHEWTLRHARGFKACAEAAPQQRNSALGSSMLRSTAGFSETKVTSLDATQETQIDNSRFNVAVASQTIHGSSAWADDDESDSKLLKLVASSYFDCCVGVLVLLNTLILGLQINHVAKSGTLDIPFGFRAVEIMFLIIFAIEIVLRIAAHGRDYLYVRGWQWHLFDMFIVGTQLMEEVLSALEASAPVNISYTRPVRLLRFIRVVRVARILRVTSELRTLVVSILGSMKSLMWTLVLLILVICMVSLCITQFVAEYRISSHDESSIGHEELKTYFGSVGATALTLFESITSGISWDDALQPLTEIHWFLGPLFALYICFAVFALLNVVTGAFVQSALRTAKEDTDYFMINNLRELILGAAVKNPRRSFASFNGKLLPQVHITWETFQQLMETPQMQDYFRAIDIDPSEAEGLFKLLDIDASGTLEAEEFLNGCLRLRGHAKALDLAVIGQTVGRLVGQFQAHALLVEQNAATRRGSGNRRSSAVSSVARDSVVTLAEELDVLTAAASEPTVCDVY